MGGAGREGRAGRRGPGSEAANRARAAPPLRASTRAGTQPPLTRPSPARRATADRGAPGRATHLQALHPQPLHHVPFDQRGEQAGVHLGLRLRRVGAPMRAGPSGAGAGRERASEAAAGGSQRARSMRSQRAATGAALPRCRNAPARQSIRMPPASGRARTAMSTDPSSSATAAPISRFTSTNPGLSAGRGTCAAQRGLWAGWGRRLAAPVIRPVLRRGRAGCCCSGACHCTGCGRSTGRTHRGGSSPRTGPRWRCS